MREIVTDIIQEGRKLGKGRCPLMYEWHGKKYWGAAHGLAGIMHVLLDMELTPEEQGNVKSVLRYMMKGRFPGGNYPSSEGSESDRLVHWCHGAPGIALTLAKASQWEHYVFLALYRTTGNAEYLYRAKAFACFLQDRAQRLISEGIMNGGDRPYSLFEGLGGMAYLFMDMNEPTEARFPAYEL
ncbi:LanC-like protein GCR2 [Bienertia sinuspersici]